METKASLRPLIYQPGRHTKDHLQAYGRALARLISPMLTKPIIEEPSDMVPKKFKGQARVESDSYRIAVLHSACRTPPSVPGYCWSYPGYKADVTPAGVWAHEIGHVLYWDAEIRLNRKEVRESLSEAARREPAVSSYEPCLAECAAEAFKLFLLNPDLLRQGRPRRFEVLSSWGISPIHDLPWREVMKYAHPKWISAAENWIKAGKKGR